MSPAVPHGLVGTEIAKALERAGVGHIATRGSHELDGGQYVERTTALADATTHLDAPFPVAIDPAGLSRQ
ncbi:hypothetical protein GCM10020367_43430 [Streptomyces sannanensis]|uniref:Uncharacterized protein n=1 Tax=Streptomyces sannanensis TaxID=285536 RepID=A0ABP6SFW8_9ACTN